MIRPPPRSTLFPSTTLFRSALREGRSRGPAGAPRGELPATPDRHVLLGGADPGRGGGGRRHRARAPRPRGAAGQPDRLGGGGRRAGPVPRLDIVLEDLQEVGDDRVALERHFEAPVHVHGRLKVTLKGDPIVADFLKILEDYIETRYGAGAAAAAP